MDSVKLVPLLVGLLIAVVMVGAIFVPVVQSSTTRTVTTEIENEGAEWLKLGYNQGTDYSFTVGFDGEDNFTVGTQTGAYKDLICYADNERTLFVSGDYWYLLTNGETPSVHKFTENASVTNASGTLTITDGTDTVYTGASPTWAYVPDANGVYGFFNEGGLNLEEGKPKVAVGSYAGVFAYNETVVAPGNANLGLTMSGDYAEGEVIWAIVPEELNTLSALPTDTLEPAVLDLDPISIHPIDLGGSGSVGLMSITPGSNTWGDWTFNTLTGNKAVICSYIGQPTDTLTIPSTVYIGDTAYTVTEVGANSNQVVDNTLINPGCKLIIPEGVTSFGANAFRNCTNFSGDLILPSTLSLVRGNVFTDCHFNGTLYTPDNVNMLWTDSLNGTLFTSWINKGPLGNVSIPFGTNTSIKEILNLGTANITTTSYGLHADSVQDHVTALGYIAPTSIHESEVVPIDSPVAGIMQMLPLIAGIGALFLAVGTMIYTRF